MSTTLDSLATRVREERRRRDWTQEELASKANVSLGMVSNFERGKNAPQPTNLRAILRALDLESEAGDDQASQTRSEWPQDVKTFLDVMGIFLTSMPDEDRGRLIHDITRQIVTRRS